MAEQPQVQQPQQQVNVDRVVSILKEQLGNLHLQLALVQTRLEEVEMELKASQGGDK